MPYFCYKNPTKKAVTRLGFPLLHFTLYTVAMPPIAHSRYTQSCKLAFALAEGIVEDKPIEQEDYWEEDCELEGVEEHGLSFITF